MCLSARERTIPTRANAPITRPVWKDWRQERWGKKAVELKDRAEVWELEADYLAQAIVDYIMVISPEMVILGGGVMHQEQLFPLIRRKVTEYVAGYVKTEELNDMEHFIVPASLHDDQGIMGCLELARRELAKR